MLVALNSSLNLSFLHIFKYNKVRCLCMENVFKYICSLRFFARSRSKKEETRREMSDQNDAWEHTRVDEKYVLT